MKQNEEYSLPAAARYNAPCNTVDATVKPYYEHAGITIYHGDCREILPSLQRVDLVLTDPPYGIASVWKGGFGSGWGKARAESSLRNEWDVKAPELELLEKIISMGRDSVIWGGNYFNLPVSRGWFVWTKPERNFSLSEAELAWTTRDNVIRVWDGIRSEPRRQHPTQKPVELFRWCLKHFPNAKSTLDPFMGSGTTLEAAKSFGIPAIGIDTEERYCEISAKRLSQEVLAF